MSKLLFVSLTALSLVFSAFGQSEAERSEKELAEFNAARNHPSPTPDPTIMAALEAKDRGTVATNPTTQADNTETDDPRDDPGYRQQATEAENTAKENRMSDPAAYRNWRLLKSLEGILHRKRLISPGGGIRITDTTLKLCISLPRTMGCIPLGPEEESYRFPGMSVEQGIPFDVVERFRAERHLPHQRGLRLPHPGSYSTSQVASR